MALWNTFFLDLNSMLFLISNTLQFYSKVSNGKSNSIYLARTDIFPWGNPIKGCFICLTRDLYSSLQEVRWSSYLIKILTQNQKKNFFLKGGNNLQLNKIYFLKKFRMKIFATSSSKWLCHMEYLIIHCISFAIQRITGEALISRYLQDTKKVSLTWAGHLQECEEYRVCMGVEKNRVLWRWP